MSVLTCRSTWSGAWPSAYSSRRRSPPSCVGFRSRTETLDLAAATLALEASLLCRAGACGRHTRPRRAQRLRQPAAQPLEGELAVAGLRALVGRDHADEGPQPLEQPGTLTRSEGAGPA